VLQRRGKGVRWWSKARRYRLASKSGRYRLAVAGSVAVSLVLIGASFLWEALHSFGVLERDLPLWFNLQADRAIPEVWGYLLTAAAAALLVGCWQRSGNALYVALALVYLFVVADDALSYHERFGDVLVDLLSLPALPGLRDDDTGELLAWALAGIPLGLLVFLTFRSSPMLQLEAAGIFLLPFAALAFFGGAMDMLHVLFGKSGRLATAIGYVEDGGELLSMNAAFALALWRFRSLPGPNAPLQKG
jgi:general stress protein CsbA